jgi:lipid-A-disaccharide synthase
VKYITLVNLLSAEDPFERGFRSPFATDDSSDHRSVPFPEYLTFKDESRQLAGHIAQWLTDDVALAERQRQLAQIKRSVARPGASQRAAEYILRQLSSHATPRVPRPHFQPGHGKDGSPVSTEPVRRRTA